MAANRQSRVDLRCDSTMMARVRAEEDQFCTSKLERAVSPKVCVSILPD